MNTQYRSKIDECVEKWQADVVQKDAKIAEMVKKAEASEKATGDVKEKLKEATMQVSLLKEKHEASKKVISNFIAEKKALESKLEEVQRTVRSSTDLRLENEQLKKELNEFRIQLNKEKVRSIYAGEKIRYKICLFCLIIRFVA